MKCIEAEKSMLLQDSGELAARKSGKLSRHLATCDSCRMFQQVLQDAANDRAIFRKPIVGNIVHKLKEQASAYWRLTLLDVLSKLIDHVQLEP